MTKSILAGAALAALVSSTAVQAQTCSDGCTTQHAVCTRAGKDYGTCMGVWRQCKAACLTPARTPAGSKGASAVAHR